MDEKKIPEGTDLREVAHLIAAELEAEEARHADWLTYAELALLVTAIVIMTVVPVLASPATLLPNLGIRSAQCIRAHRLVSKP